MIHNYCRDKFVFVKHGYIRTTDNNIVGSGLSNWAEHTFATAEGHKHGVSTTTYPSNSIRPLIRFIRNRPPELADWAEWAHFKGDILWFPDRNYAVGIEFTVAYHAESFDERQRRVWK